MFKVGDKVVIVHTTQAKGFELYTIGLIGVIEYVNSFGINVNFKNKTSLGFDTLGNGIHVSVKPSVYHLFEEDI